MRIVAIIAIYNEQRFIQICLEHYRRQGVEVYLLDNESSDATMDIARSYLGDPVAHIETIPRQGKVELKRILRRKEVIADELRADWLIHADTDEIRVPPPTLAPTLAESIEIVDREGYNAINFMEYTFVPTEEEPEHTHNDFLNTMHWYYPFAPTHPHRLNAWKKQPRRWPGLKRQIRELLDHRRLVPAVNISDTGGHRVAFPGLKPYPHDFIMRHYMLLGREHVKEKYLQREYDTNAAKAGFHGWRATATLEDFVFPSQSRLRRYIDDAQLDPSDPQAEHMIIRPR